MEHGALIRKHAFDAVLLCCLICISFFAANTSYTNVIGDPNYTWSAGSSITILPNNTIYVQSGTSLYLGSSQYDSAYVSAILTNPDGSRQTLSNCGYPSGSVSWYLTKAPGVYSVAANHYIGLGNCTGTYVGSTSDSLDLTHASIDYFYANPSNILPSGSATLYWSTTSGTSFNINGTPVAATGSMVVNPTTNTVYTLTASNSYGSVQARVTVRTSDPLVSNYFNYSVRHEKGIPQFFPFMNVEQESVNSANGNLYFTIPLLSRPGRNGLGVNLSLAYNSKIWDFFVQSSTLYATIPEHDSWVGLGWTLTMGRLIDDSANGYYYLTSSDGSNHVLKYYGSAWRSIDSTYMIYDPTTYKLTLKGGSSLQFGYQDPFRTYIRYATKIKDVNGNYLDISYSGTGGTINTIQDTLGNTYSFLLSSSGQLQYISYWNTNDTTQATGTVSLDYQLLTPSFGSGASPDPLLSSQPGLCHLTYLTGVRYGFTYNSSGQLATITYPTLGTSRYFYTQYTVLDRLLNQTVPDYYVTSHDTGAGTATWTWNTNPSGNAAPSTVVISIPGRADTTHYMQKSSTGWADGLVTRVLRADSVAQEDTRDWTQDGLWSTTIYNPRATWIRNNTYIVSPYTSKSVRKTFTYASSTDYSGNVKEIDEYAFDDATVRRRTTISYLHESNSSYVSLNILDRVSSTLVYDGSGNLISKTTTTFDSSSLYDAPNAIRHDTAFGTSYLTRGLPTSVSRWYNIAQNLYVTTANRYDVCGNTREATDARSNTTYAQYWVSASDNAYAFPLVTVNAKGHTTQATYSYKSGVTLTAIDPNGIVTTMTYDNNDRVIQITKPDGWQKTFIYVESPSYQFPPYALARQYLVAGSYVEKKMDLDNMGRLSSETALGNIIQNQTYDSASAVNSKSVLHVSGQTAYYANYSTGGVYQQSVSYPDGRSVNYYNGPGSVNVQRDDGIQRTYYYQEDGKISEVLEQDPATGNLNAETDYYYDSLGRLTTISQGVQTRSYTYDNLGRLLTESLPESGTTSYVYDANSNVVSKTDARGTVTAYSYDEINRITTKSYSDGTPTANYFYDSQPAGSPITTTNPIGRLTEVTTTTSNVTASNFYSYCSCSSVNQEATVINDGTAKTYITSYSYNLAGQLTAIAYPNGKVVTYTRDSQGREIQASSTYNGQAFNYVSGASYGGPQGALTEIDYPISISPRSYTGYTYDPTNLFLTRMKTPDGDLGFSYLNASGQATALIQDVTNYDNPNANEHFAYDNWDRLTAYWFSNHRTDTPSRKLQLSYDRYGNIASVAETISGVTQTYAFSVDATTNRLSSRTKSGGTATFSYDAAGNMTSNGTFDAENRLTSSNGITYLYDGNGRHFRRHSASTVNYIYSYSGQLLAQESVTDSTTFNFIYFAGQVRAIQGQQDGTFKLLYRSPLGSTRSSYIVTLPNYTATLCEQYGYDPWGQIISSTQYTPPYTHFLYQGKERQNNLDDFGARYYDSASVANGSPMRWISADSVTSRIYDPQSLNKYTYVRDDPVNLVDPDGDLATSINGEGVIIPDIPIIFRSTVIAGPEVYPRSIIAINDSSVPFSHDPTLAFNATLALGIAAGLIQNNMLNPDSNLPPICRAQPATSFITANRGGAALLAGLLNVPASFILAMAGEESTFGKSPAALGANNFFGLHVGAPGSIGPWDKNPILAAFPRGDGFLISGQSFVQIAKSLLSGVKNPSDPTAFFTAMHAKFGLGYSLQGYLNEMTGPGGVATMTTIRMNCP